MSSQRTPEELKQHIAQLEKEIADLKQDQFALQKNEDSFQILIETLWHGVQEIDKDGKILFANSAHHRIHEYNNGELIGKSIFDLSSSDSERNELRDYLKYLISEQPEPTPWFGKDLTKYGKLKDVRVDWNYKRDKRGNVIGFISIITDVTLYKQAELALEESEKRYQTFVNNFQGIAYRGTTDFIPIFVHGAVEEITGYSEQDFVSGRPSWNKIIFPDDLPKALEDGEKIRTIPNFSYQREYRIIRKDGQIRWVYDMSHNVCDKSDTPILVEGTVYDITKRKQVEEALVRSEEQYRSLVENIDLGISLIDTNHNIVMVNTIYANFFQKSPDYFRGKKCFQELKKRDQVCEHCLGTVVMETGRPKEVEIEEMLDDSSKTIKIRAFPVMGQDGKVTGFIEVVEDITKSRKIEEDLQRIKQLESIGVLAGGIAHDFNNMLTAILGNIDLAQLNLSPEENVYEILENAKNASMQAQKLTQQLLTFSRGGEPVKRQINLKKLLYDSAALALSGSSVKCEYRVADKLWAIKADEGQISQVFSNVLLNAVQSMPEGGVVKIRAENITIEPDEQPQLLSGKYVKISVVDQGVGIPTKYFTKVFDPYFSTKQAGSGLGLATSHSIISKHKGYISVESTLGIGTTINVYLPASAKMKTLVETRVQFKPKDGSGKILIMDDEEVVRIAVSDTLEHLGYKPYTARDGEEAIALYKRAMEMARPFDAVIMDLTIRGGMGGKSAIKKLLRIDPNAKVIVSSGYSNDPVMADFQSYGFSGVINKPYKVLEVSEVLKKILQKEP